MMEGGVKEGIIYTIGHSTHEIENFVALLKQYRINAVADVRSVPYSHRQPHFNREHLTGVLKAHGIAYVFLGKELGARSEDPSCYEKGRVKYRLLAKTPLFRSGIERIRNGSRRKTIALMCAEKDPLDCHRSILVARELVEAGSDIAHVLVNGQLEPHSDTVGRLLKKLRLPEQDMFRTAEELMERAHATQEGRIAYVKEERGVEARTAQQ